MEREEEEDVDSGPDDSDHLDQEEGEDADASEPQSRLVSKAFADRQHPIVAGGLRELCKAHGDDRERSRIVLLEIRVMMCG